MRIVAGSGCCSLKVSYSFVDAFVQKVRTADARLGGQIADGEAKFPRDLQDGGAAGYVARGYETRAAGRVDD